MRRQILGQPIQQILVPRRLLHVIHRAISPRPMNLAQRRLTMVRDNRPSFGHVTKRANSCKRACLLVVAGSSPSCGNRNFAAAFFPGRLVALVYFERGIAVMLAKP